jgi:hypothetical protein
VHPKKEATLNSFSLPIQDIEKYQRATTRLIHEGVSGLVENNTTLERIAKRISRSFNTTGSKSALDRWKGKKGYVKINLISLSLTPSLCL